MMKTISEIKTLWAKFCLSDQLVCGAWWQSPWEELPLHIQKEFIEVFGELDK